MFQSHTWLKAVTVELCHDEVLTLLGNFSVLNFNSGPHIECSSAPMKIGLFLGCDGGVEVGSGINIPLLPSLNFICVCNFITVPYLRPRKKKGIFLVICWEVTRFTADRKNCLDISTSVSQVISPLLNEKKTKREY